MNFKVAGAKKGITSIQMDLKVDGLTPEIIKRALETTHRGRDEIIDKILLPAIPAPRAEVSRYAPGKEGLVHISKLQKVRTEKVEDVCNVGDTVRVKFLGTDEKGRQNLSMKDAD